jgi:thiosulfate dehydrogenase [quinone] large subunit
MSTATNVETRQSQIPEPNIARFLFADTRMAPVWLIVRVYLGVLWLLSGWEKLMSPAWVGNEAGAAVTASRRARRSRPPASILR